MFSLIEIRRLFCWWLALFVGKQATKASETKPRIRGSGLRKRWTATSEKPRTGDRQKSGSLAFEKKEENHPIYSKAIQKGSRERERKRIQKGSRERERNPVRLELSLDARHSRLVHLPVQATGTIRCFSDILEIPRLWE
jgi:adenine-specific DNA methylase